MKHLMPVLLGALLVTLLTGCGEADLGSEGSHHSGTPNVSTAPAVDTATDYDEPEASSTSALPTSTRSVEPSSDPPVATDEHTATFTADRPTTLELSDVKIATSLEEMIEDSEIVFVGTVIGPNEIVNQARDTSDVTEEDPRIFIVGQVYAVSVEQYVKGDGPDILNVVQSEGLIYNDDKPVSLPDEQEEIEAIKVRYGEKPIKTEATYLFFVDRLQGFDPRLDYVAATAGYPTRFLLSEEGIATPESPIEEANSLFEPRPVTELLEEAESLSRDG